MPVVCHSDRSSLEASSTKRGAAVTPVARSKCPLLFAKISLERTGSEVPIRLVEQSRAMFTELWVFVAVVLHLCPRHELVYPTTPEGGPRSRIMHAVAQTTDDRTWRQQIPHQFRKHANLWMLRGMTQDYNMHLHFIPGDLTLVSAYL